MKIGVNFEGFKCADYQNRPKVIQSPKNYISDSFKIFAENGLNCVRVPVYWESFEKDPPGFKEELDNISNQADKYNISCIYDNHQWMCSSYLGYGRGFPNSILRPFFNRDNPENFSLNKPNHEDLEKFWNAWWDRKMITAEGKEGWDAQLEYFTTVVNNLKDKKSTYGFEILNEPQVFRQKDFKNVSYYNDFFIKNIAKLTDKTLFFCYTSSGSLKAIDFPWNQSKTKPSIKIKNNIILDIHPYPPNFIISIYYKLISRLLKNIPLFVGEFNSSIGENARISPSQYKQYIKRLNNFSTPGGLFWQWSHMEDAGHPAFNLAKIVDERIHPNENFDNYINAVKENND
jgi:hypothetical protein